MSDPLPDKIGKYPITREIGRGATSVVYLGRDPFANREVAIKLVRDQSPGDTDLRRRFHKVFLNEAALVGKLFHPHILAIYDAVSEPDLSYIVMEYVDGRTLEHYCDVANLLPVSKVVEIVFKCSLALAFAQRHGVIHCDIKPANILISGETDIKISDFGAALYDAAEHTHLKGVGSPAYMSPEQVQDKELDFHTDIYSLGALMYQMLTGKLPFRASSKASLLYQVVNIPPVPPSTFRRDIPADLDRVAMRCLEKSPEARYPTWSDFSRELTYSYRSLEVPTDAVSDTEKFSTLKTLSFFREFRDQELWEVVRIASWRKLLPGPLRDPRGRQRRELLRHRQRRGQGHQVGPAAQHPAPRRLLRGDALLRRDQHAALDHHHLAVSPHGGRDQGREPGQGLGPAAEGDEQGLPAHPDRPPHLGQQSLVGCVAAGTSDARHAGSVQDVAGRIARDPRESNSMDSQKQFASARAAAATTAAALDRTRLAGALPQFEPGSVLDPTVQACYCARCLRELREASAVRGGTT